MMTSSANNRGFSRMGVDPTISGLVDGTDFPHSALFHALNIATQGSYAIIEGNDFDITQSDSSGKTQFSVAAGKVVRNGALQAAVSTANFTQGTPAEFEEPTSGFSYYLLVVNSSNALELKNNGGTIITDTVPNPANTDIPIAVLRLGAGETTTQRHVQFLTTTKTSNSLSIARDDSGVYTESASIQSNAGDIEIEALEQDKDIIFKVNDGGLSTEAMRIDGATAKVGIGTNAPSSLLHLAGAGIPTIKLEDTDTAGGYAHLEVNGAALFIESYDEDGTVGHIIFKNATSEAMRIQDDGNIGIGTTSPTELLHLSDADGTEPTILIENTGTHANEPELVFMRSTATGADSRDIGNIRFKARDTAGNYHTYCQILCDQIDADTTTEDGRLVFSLTQAGTDFVEFLTMGNLESVFNGAGNDINFRVEGSSEANLLFVDAGNDKVGIGTSSPSETLHVSGNVLIEDPSSTGSSDHLLEVKSGSSSTPDNARIIISADTDAKLPMLHLRDVEANSGTFNANHSAYIALDRATAIVTGSAQNDLLIANGNYNKDIHLCTNNAGDGSGAQARLTIVGSDGDVGIGTTTPSEKLTVQGNISSSGDVIVGGDLDHDGSNIGFFGINPASRQTVTNIVSSPILTSSEPTAAELSSTQTAISNLETKLNDILDALRLYGLIS